jgi:hypothetical protein
MLRLLLLSSLLLFTVARATGEEAEETSSIDNKPIKCLIESCAGWRLNKLPEVNLVVFFLRGSIFSGSLDKALDKAGILGCHLVNCYLTHPCYSFCLAFSQVRSFIYTEAPLYDSKDVEVKFVGGDPRAVFLNKAGQEVERVPLSDLTEAEVRRMLKEVFFSCSSSF